MTPHIPEEFSTTRLIDWSPFVIMGDTMLERLHTETTSRQRIRS
jgi:hypothetical protein